MEQKQSEVVVFGTWASSFSGRVEIALKLKGIPNEFVEEDLSNKSELLLHYNPVHKKIIPTIYTINGSKGQEREKVIEEFSELLKVFEEGIQRDFPGKPPFFNDDGNVSFLGIEVNSYACSYPALHEAIAVIISPEKNSTFMSWVNSLRECPLIKETLPDHD
ncbi:hypothetical protein TIFTF001_011078 [Ficus carica]|uniref:Glutathione S-transferase n=1 Tax=Ficus carica TaxID=3494 RepID=A0AA88D2J6_FICCA|nr:hypothetical protein TIFTF001_011078 [Ficus carica]